MALNTALTQSIQHRMALTPAMRESIALLSMSTAELVRHIEEEALNNPLLKIEPRSFSNNSGISEYDVALDTIAAQETLGENLRRQLAIMPIDSDTKEVALYLTGDLTENGFLSQTAQSYARALSLPIEMIDRGIAALQNCEPTGIGARGLKECLLLQLIEAGIDTEIAAKTLESAALFTAQNWAELTTIFKLPETQLQNYAETLKALKFNPAQSYAHTTIPLIADIVVTSDPQKGLTVSLKNPCLPTLSVDDFHLKSAQSDEDSLPYLNTQRDRAKALIQGVEFRGKTILHVAQSIVSTQHRFFTERNQHLVPLTRAKIAKQLKMHPSTIGRAIAEKNLSINGAIYPLRYFFSPSLGAADKKPVSAHNIKRQIRELVSTETTLSILSDEKIVEILHAQGVDIARRTVAKYRGCMNIPSSTKRRHILAAKATAPNGMGGAGYTRS